MKDKSYKIQGVDLSQGELTLRKDKEIIKLWYESDVNIDELTSSGTIQEILRWLLSSDILERFLEIVLTGETGKIVWDDITNSQLEIIVIDFLALNGGWIGKLNGYLSSLTPAEITEK